MPPPRPRSRNKTESNTNRAGRSACGQSSTAMTSNPARPQSNSSCAPAREEPAVQARIAEWHSSGFDGWTFVPEALEVRDKFQQFLFGHMSLKARHHGFVARDDLRVG